MKFIVLLLCISVVYGLPVNVEEIEPKAKYDAVKKSTVWWNPFSLSGINLQAKEENKSVFDDVAEQGKVVIETNEDNIEEPLFSFPTINTPTKVSVESNPFLNGGKPVKVNEKDEVDSITSFPAKPDEEVWITRIVAPDALEVEVHEPKRKHEQTFSDDPNTFEDKEINEPLFIDDDEIPDFYKEDQQILSDNDVDLDFTDLVDTEEAHNFDAITSYLKESADDNPEVKNLLNRLSQGSSGQYSAQYQGVNGYTAQKNTPQVVPSGGLDPRLAAVLGERNSPPPQQQPQQQFQQPQFQQQQFQQQQFQPEQEQALDPRLSAAFGGPGGYPPQSAPQPQPGFDPRLSAILGQRGGPQMPPPGVHPGLAAHLGAAAKEIEYGDYPDYNQYGGGQSPPDYPQYGQPSGGQRERVKIIRVPVPVPVHVRGPGQNHQQSFQAAHQAQAFRQQQQAVIAQQQAIAHQAAISQQQAIAQQQAQAQQQAFGQQQNIGQQQGPDYPNYPQDRDYDLVTIRVPKGRGGSSGIPPGYQQQIPVPVQPPPQQNQQQQQRYVLVPVDGK